MIVWGGLGGILLVDRNSVYLTMSNIAVLTEIPDQPVSIDQNTFGHMLTPPLNIGQTIGGQLVISSPRDQLEVVLVGNRIEVRDLSGKTEFSERKIPKLVGDLLQFITAPVKGYGINFHLTIKHDNAAQWLVDLIFSHEIKERTGKSLVGGSATLRMEHKSKMWQITLQPRSVSELQVDFNAHENTQQLPQEEHLQGEMAEQFDALLETLTDLGL